MGGVKMKGILECNKAELIEILNTKTTGFKIIDIETIKADEWFELHIVPKNQTKNGKEKTSKEG